MMRKRGRKTIAAFFLFVLTAQLLAPFAAHALTSGPAQPETSKFSEASVGDMVDLFSGDLKYNIPIVDVGGYPLSLAYNSGTGVEDEGSWVGTGWTLNPGSVNRTLRGLPDEFDGSPGIRGKNDCIIKDFYQKDFKKVGAKLTIKPSALAWEHGGASLHLDIYKDNYYGIGASLGADLGLSASLSNSTPLTAGLDLGINSDVRDGVGINPSFSLSAQQNLNSDLAMNHNLSGGFGYNTRSGLKSVSLSASFSTVDRGAESAPLSLSGEHYFGQTSLPAIQHNMASETTTFSVDFGPSVFSLYAGLGGAGYMTKQTNLEPHVVLPAYGYLNYVKARKRDNALLDFNREKDGVFLISAPAISTPVATQDLFVATSQTGSEQFRPYFGGNYIVHDKKTTGSNSQKSAGLTVGVLNIFKGGARLEHVSSTSGTNSWVNSNDYFAQQDAALANAGADPTDEPVYFKQIGEHTWMDTVFRDEIGMETERVITRGNNTDPLYRQRSGTRPSAMVRHAAREKRGYTFSYLTAKEATGFGLDTKINGQPRIDNVHKAHHLSEITVTSDDGKRIVYGLPVYNLTQEDCSFAVAAPASSQMESCRRTGLINYVHNQNGTPVGDDRPNNGNGRDEFYSRETTPGYATSFLITGILSPDYVDVTHDGITDDDHGSAVKFSYNKVADAANPYQWRAPYEANMANYNEGFLSDPKDDRGSYVYGQKELWYLDKIESKTMIALFKTSNREDGLGVQGRTGGRETGVHQKKLDAIELYSKADYLKNGASATPIKVVHFEYDYSLYPNVPNNSGASVDKTGAATENASENVNAKKGKLTLKRVYFTFGRNARGQSNPYEFDYDVRNIRDAAIVGLPKVMDPADPEYSDDYAQRQSDRWGTYKKSFYNHPLSNVRTLNNSEFPFVPQKNENTPYDERQLADLFASKWQLNKITTPSGGIISVQYESDDYAFVQNKKAMQMCFLKGIQVSDASLGLIGATKLKIELPRAVGTLDAFKEKYLQQDDGRLMDKLFYKVLVDVDNAGHYEYVNGYAEIDYSSLTASDLSSDGKTISLPLKPVNGVNPVAQSSWQLLQTSLPQYAYDAYDNSEVGDGVAAIRSIIAAFTNLREISRPFSERAKNRRYAKKVDFSRSMVRLNNPGVNSQDDIQAAYANGMKGDINYAKIGGGCRVRKITISDDWNVMSVASPKASYGQLYDYAVRDSKGNFLYSSGVAAYEPGIGNEENPFHEPLNFTEKIHWSSDRYHFIEKPFCESYFPAAGVGYSRVRVSAIGDDYNGDPQAASNFHTGYTVSDFYTAKDFPTLVENLPVDVSQYESGLTLRLFSSRSVKKVTASQGFKVELNDMHGKPRSTQTFNQSGDLIASSESFYHVKDAGAEKKELDNTVPVMAKDGGVSNRMLGTEIDLVTDLRESFSQSQGTSIGAYTGGMGFPPFFYIPYLGINYNRTSNYEDYHSASVVKVIHRFGIVEKVVTMQNGSTINAENLLWDGLTGSVLLTKTQNEFDKYTYGFNYPAYMVADYSRMGAAYQNQGALFTSFATGTNGQILCTYSDYLAPGDELIPLSDPSAVKGWVMRSPGGVLRLIDENGAFISTIGSYKVLRSGWRNLLQSTAGTVVLSANPIENDRVNLDAIGKKILDSKAALFKEEWAVPVSDKYLSTTAGARFLPSGDFYQAFCNSLFAVNPNTGRRYLFSYASDQVTVADVINAGLALGFFSPADHPLQNFFYSLDNAATPPNPASVHYALDVARTGSTGPDLQAGDQAHLSYNGQAIDEITFTMLTPDFVSFLNASSTFPIADPEGSISGTDYKVALFSNPYCGPGDGGSPYRYERIDSSKGTAHRETAEVGPNCFLSMKIIPLSIQAAIPPTCQSPVDKIINPYFTGLLGIWRPYVSYAYSVDREQKPGNPTRKGGTDIRNSGYYSTYTPFWIFDAGDLKRNTNAFTPAADFTRWISTNQSVYYDDKSNELESLNALNQSGSALFGYRQSMPVAVASNSRHNEIAFDGFEDYNFDLQPNVVNPCPRARHLDLHLQKSGSDWVIAGTQNKLVGDQAHTGNYSLKLLDPITISSGSGLTGPPPLLNFDAPGHYVLQNDELNYGFRPITGKKYLISMWINDHSPFTNTIQRMTSISINNQPIGLSGRIVPVVEGWKRLQFSVTVNGAFSMVIIPSGEVELDDIRIVPDDGQMVSYVYSDMSLRLMAQLDENNFATLYEYDDEGTLIRLKKETERGVVTLKENRQALRAR